MPNQNDLTQPLLPNTQNTAPVGIFRLAISCFHGIFSLRLRFSKLAKLHKLSGKQTIKSR